MAQPCPRMGRDIWNISFGMVTFTHQQPQGAVIKYMQGRPLPYLYYLCRAHRSKIIYPTHLTGPR